MYNRFEVDAWIEREKVAVPRKTNSEGGPKNGKTNADEKGSC